MTEVPAADNLRQRIADAIRAATCNGDCGQTEEECTQRRIQPVVWHFGVLAEVSGTPEQFADAVLAELADTADRTETGPTIPNPQVTGTQSVDNRRDTEGPLT